MFRKIGMQMSNNALCYYNNKVSCYSLMRQGCMAYKVTLFFICISRCLSMIVGNNLVIYRAEQK